MNRRVLARMVGVTAVCSGLAVLVAAKSGSRLRTTPRPIPAPEFHRVIESVSRSEVLRYAESLQFDTSYHAVDSRRLVSTNEGKVTVGPLAAIAPEVGSTSMSWAALDSGRILARVTVDAPDSLRGFAKGENYIWVERRNDHLHAVVIPADVAAPTRAFQMSVIHKDMMAAGRPPEARFRWNDVTGANFIWVACAGGCCTGDPGDGRPKPE